MVMEHSHDSESHSIHDLAHSENPSSHQAKMEIMLLKIAIDAVDAYNHVCKDHKIDIISIDNAQSNSVHEEVDNAVQMQKNYASQHDAESAEEIADEEAMAALTAALESEANEASSSYEDELEFDDAQQETISAESISNMISGTEAEPIEANTVSEDQPEVMETSTDDVNNHVEVQPQQSDENNSASTLTATVDADVHQENVASSDAVNTDAVNTNTNDEVAVNVAQEESMVNSEQEHVAQSSAAMQPIKTESTELDAIDGTATNMPAEQTAPSIQDENNASE